MPLFRRKKQEGKKKDKYVYKHTALCIAAKQVDICFVQVTKDLILISNFIDLCKSSQQRKGTCFLRFAANSTQKTTAHSRPPATGRRATEEKRDSHNRAALPSLGLRDVDLNRKRISDEY